MRYFYLLSLILSGLSLLAQDKSVKVIYPRTISIKSDSFQLYYPTWKEPETFKNIDSDTLDMGNDAVKNAYYLIISGHDTVRINYSNFPFAEQIFVPMELNGRKFTHRLRVKAVTAYYSADYITENSQRSTSTYQRFTNLLILFGLYLREGKLPIILIKVPNTIKKYTTIFPFSRSFCFQSHRFHEEKLLRSIL
jgi:hypothetical protein